MTLGTHIKHPLLIIFRYGPKSAAPPGDRGYSLHIRNDNNGVFLKILILTTLGVTVASRHVYIVEKEDTVCFNC